MRPRTLTTVVFLAGVAIAAGLVVVSLAVPETSPDIWPELLKAGVQIGLVGLVASAVTQMLGFARDLREYHLRVFTELADAYNGIKAVRRTLRGLGFREPTGDRLSAEQADKYFDEMQSLIASQLALERINSELATRSDRFRFRSERAVGKQLSIVEKHIHDLIREWEDFGWKIVEGADTKCVRDRDLLQAFLKTRSPSFKRNVVDPMSEVEKWLRSRLYGG